MYINDNFNIDIIDNIGFFFNFVSDFFLDVTWQHCLDPNIYTDLGRRHEPVKKR